MHQTFPAAIRNDPTGVVADAIVPGMVPESYSIEEEIRDIGRYHWACSFSNALASLSREVAKPIQPNSAQIIERIRLLTRQKENMSSEADKADVDVKIKELVLRLAEPGE